MQRLGMTGVQKLGVSDRCAKIGQDTDRHTNIGCETDRCANIEPDTQSWYYHKTSYHKTSEITHCKLEFMIYKIPLVYSKYLEYL